MEILLKFGLKNFGRQGKGDNQGFAPGTKEARIATATPLPSIKADMS